MSLSYRRRNSIAAAAPHPYPGRASINPVFGAGDSARDQALAAELFLGLFERDVGRREDQVGAFQLVIIERTAAGADQLQQVVENRAEGRVIACLTGGHGLVV